MKILLQLLLIIMLDLFNIIMWYYKKTYYNKKLHYIYDWLLFTFSQILCYSNKIHYIIIHTIILHILLLILNIIYYDL